MRINQVLVAASPGDAITDAAMALRDALRGVVPSDIYARYYDERLVGDVLPLDHLGRSGVSEPGRPEDDLVIFHASIGDPDVFSFIRQRPERLVVVHHNISPAEAFMAYDPAFAGLLAEGRRQLKALSHRAVLALAASQYNAEDLRGLGYRNVQVSPLILKTDLLLDGPDHEPTANHLREHVHGPVMVFVGQMLPHKRPDFLVQAYHLLSTHLVPDAWLIMIGTSRLPRYSEALGHLIRELHLPRAWMAGRVSDEELATFYRRADLFVTASEHEGFCAPLIEAMAFETPVLARSFAAIPETVGHAGLLLPPDDGPGLMAEAMAELLANEGLRKELVGLGLDRVEHYRPERAVAIALQHLLTVV